MTATYTFDIFSSLDGYGAAGGNWTGYWGKQGPELLDHRLALYGAAQRMVFGANTYRLFVEMLASSAEESEVRDPWITRMWTCRQRWCRRRWKNHSTGRMWVEWGQFGGKHHQLESGPRPFACRRRGGPPRLLSVSEGRVASSADKFLLFVDSTKRAGALTAAEGAVGVTKGLRCTDLVEGRGRVGVEMQTGGAQVLVELLDVPGHDDGCGDGVFVDHPGQRHLAWGDLCLPGDFDDGVDGRPVGRGL
jgi:hypothetical protein